MILNCGANPLFRSIEQEIVKTHFLCQIKYINIGLCAVILFSLPMPMPMKKTKILEISWKKLRVFGQVVVEHNNGFDNCIIINLFAHFAYRFNWNAAV